MGTGEGGNSLTIGGTGNITSGNGKDLDITWGSGATANYTMNANIVDNNGTSIGLTVGQAGNVGGNFFLGGTNTFTGDTFINGTGSSLTIANPLALQNSTLNYLTQSGTFSFGTLTAATLGGLRGNHNLALTNTSATPAVALTIGGNNQSTTYSGNLSGTGSLTKVGTGTLTLQGSSNYTGATTVNGGKLQLNSGGSINGSSAYNILAGTFDTGGSLALTGSQSISGGGMVLGAVSLASGTITPGNPGTIGILSLNPSISSSGLTLVSGSTLSSLLGTPGTSSPGTGSLVAVNGNLTLPASGLTLKLFDNANANGQGSIEAGLYDLISFTGTLSGFNAMTTFNAVTTSPLIGRTYTFVNQNNQIDLIIGAGTLSLTFTGQDGGTGAADSLWSNGSQTNFANGSAPHAYADPNSVTFGDTNAANGNAPITNSNVTIVGTVTPATVTFTNSSVVYTLSGSGSIAGPATTLTKNGTALVNLQTSNTFGGAVAIKAGAIDISNGSALGVSSGVTVANGRSSANAGKYYGCVVATFNFRRRFGREPGRGAGQFERDQHVRRNCIPSPPAGATVQSDAGLLTLERHDCRHGCGSESDSCRRRDGRCHREYHHRQRIGHQDWNRHLDTRGQQHLYGRNQPECRDS